jgi:predicted ATPase/DNA-binding SARP family transcriptional activator
MPQLTIRVFGGLQIRLDDEPVGGFISAKIPALLVYLAVTRQAHSREKLANLLWGEFSDADAKNNLRQALSNLRKYFQPYLLFDHDQVQFNATPPFFLDAEAFNAHIQAGMLSAAAALYQGDFLAGFHVRDAPDFETWLASNQAQFHEQATQIFQTLTLLHSNAGEYSQAIAFCNRLLSLDPWREEAHRLLMLLQARTGQISAALAQYEACRKILAQELRIEPSAETTALYEQIRAARYAPRHNLPGQVTAFIGRECELDALRRHLANPDCRLLTLTGPGGIGKTRLAIRAALDNQAMFLHGARFIPCAALSADPGALVLATAEVLGLDLSTAGDAQRTLFDHLRPKDILLVFDNVEHLLDLGAWFCDLLHAAPSITILATSRQRFDLASETAFELEGLSLPVNGEVKSSDAVQLFLHAARRSRSDFVFDEANLPAVSDICRLVGGMPLGLELAAAWVHAFSCAEIARQITQNLDFLTARYRDTSPRQNSLRAVFNWSWEHLTYDEQTTFRRLAVFRGAFDSEAALEVTESSSITLADLAAKSLVWRREERFALHEAARQFAAEMLAQASETESIRDRHARYYSLRLARECERFAAGKHEQALTAIEKDFDDIQTAWYWLAERQDVSGLAAAIDGLYHFVAIRSRFRQALELFSVARQALASLPVKDAARLTYCRLAARQGRFLSFLSRYDEANECLLESLARLRELDEPDEMAFVLGHLGGTARMQGKISLAEEYLRECLALRQKTGNIQGQAVAWLELAGIAYVSHDYDAAHAHCLEGLTTAEQAGDAQTTAHLLTGLSLALREMGHYEAALDYVRRSQAVYERLGDRYGVIQATLTLGELNRKMGNFEDARQFCEQAVTVSREIGYQSGEADGYFRLGQVALSTGDLAQAKQHQATALALAEMLNELPLLLDTLFEIGNIFLKTGQPGKAAFIFLWLQSQPEVNSQRQAEIESILAGMDNQLTVAASTAGTFSWDGILRWARSALNI